VTAGSFETSVCTKLRREVKLRKKKITCTVTLIIKISSIFGHLKYRYSLQMTQCTASVPVKLPSLYNEEFLLFKNLKESRYLDDAEFFVVSAINER
jgi:hypothetical protein